MKAAREQVLAYRVAAHQFDRHVRSVGELAVLEIGVQDAAGEQARLAFDARLPSTPPREVVEPGGEFALVWSLRGAPHIHRRADLDDVTGALYPLSEADAALRLNESAPSVERAGIAAVDQFAVAAEQLRAAVRRPTAKGAVSTAVTSALPATMRRPCRGCGTSHISDTAMRTASLSAGLELEPRTSPPVLLRRKGTRLVHKPDLDALATLARACLTLLGPATPADVAGYLGVRGADLKAAWPDDLVEVRVGSSNTWLPRECVAAFESAPAPDLVRLLGGNDPYLQARDRAVLVPDKSLYKQLWPVLGKPGVVFADGEVVGTWRANAKGSKLTLAVTEFTPLAKPVWSAVEHEAERVAAVRDLTLVGVSRS